MSLIINQFKHWIWIVIHNIYIWTALNLFQVYKFLWIISLNTVSYVITFLYFINLKCFIKYHFVHKSSNNKIHVVLCFCSMQNLIIIAINIVYIINFVASKSILYHFKLYLISSNKVTIWVTFYYHYWWSSVVNFIS